MRRRTSAFAKRLATSFALVLQLAALTTRADPPRLEDMSSYSPYERETAQIGLQRTGRELEPDPEGKIIEGIDVVTLEVFEDRDQLRFGLNRIANFFHVTTKPHFVRRELLFKVGEPYRRRIAEESARNIRGLSQLTVVILLPTKGSAPDRVRMLLVTKDLWSLRVPIEYQITSNGGIEEIDAQLTEINLLGTHHQLAANFSYRPDWVSWGGTLIVPRLWDTRLRLVADLNVIYNFKTNEVEGTFGQIGYSRPLFSLATEWSYGMSIGWRNDIARRYSAAQVTLFDPSQDRCRLDNDETQPIVGGIPCLYNRDRQAGTIYVTRSFGREIKHNFTLSADAVRDVYRTPDLSGYDPAVAARFRQRVPPLSDTRIGPELQYSGFSASFMRLLDFERLGLQEEYQLGHNVILRVAPSYAPLRDERLVVRTFAAASYTVPLGNGLFRGYAEAQTDFEPSRIPDGSIDVGARVVTPRTPIGRLVVDGRVLHRYANYLNAVSFLGGDTRLRGYRSSEFNGKDLVALNLEYRSRPVEILKTQLGGVLFLDSGAAFDGFENLRLGSDRDRDRDPRVTATGGVSAGFGLRLFLPQVNRVVIRADWGFPIARGYRDPDGFPGELTVTFGQAFPVPVVPTSAATVN